MGGDSEPSWPVFIAWSMSRASPPRTSPTMIRSGRMRRALRTRVAHRHLASPLHVRRPGLERDDVGLASRSSAASSIVISRSSSGMNAGQHAEQGRLAAAGAARARSRSTRARTHAARNSQTSRPDAARAGRGPRGENGLRANFRIVSTGPRSERGGMIAWTRCPPGVERPPKATIRRPGGPGGPRCARSGGRRPPPPRIDRSSTLSIRPFRSTYTSSGPLTMTSVTSGSFSRNSMGPNPTTSSETSFDDAREVALRKDVALRRAGSRAPPRAPARVARCAAPSRGRARPPAAAAARGDRDAPAPSRRRPQPHRRARFEPRLVLPSGGSDTRGEERGRDRAVRGGAALDGWNATRRDAPRTSPGRPISPSRPGDRSDNSKGTRCAVRLVRGAMVQMRGPPPRRAISG